jgi:hypothetical protein
MRQTVPQHPALALLGHAAVNPEGGCQTLFAVVVPVSCQDAVAF